MEYKEKAKKSNAISRQSKGFKERKGEKNKLTKAKTSQEEEKKQTMTNQAKGIKENKQSRN